MHGQMHESKHVPNACVKRKYKTQSDNIFTFSKYRYQNLTLLIKTVYFILTKHVILFDMQYGSKSSNEIDNNTDALIKMY